MVGGRSGTLRRLQLPRQRAARASYARASVWRVRRGLRRAPTDRAGVRRHAHRSHAGVWGGKARRTVPGLRAHPAPHALAGQRARGGGLCGVRAGALAGGLRRARGRLRGCRARGPVSHSELVHARSVRGADPTPAFGRRRSGQPHVCAGRPRAARPLGRALATHRVCGDRGCESRRRDLAGRAAGRAHRNDVPGVGAGRGAGRPSPVRALGVGGRRAELGADRAVLPRAAHLGRAVGHRRRQGDRESHPPRLADAVRADQRDDALAGRGARAAGFRAHPARRRGDRGGGVLRALALPRAPGRAARPPALRRTVRRTRVAAMDLWGGAADRGARGRVDERPACPGAPQRGVLGGGGGGWRRGEWDRGRGHVGSPRCGGGARGQRRRVCPRRLAAFRSGPACPSRDAARCLLAAGVQPPDVAPAGALPSGLPTPTGVPAFGLASDG